MHKHCGKKMGKPKKSNVQPAKNIALDKQITAGKVAKQKGKKSVLHLRAEEQTVLDSKTSNKILNEAKRQQLEVEAEEDFPPLAPPGKKGRVKFNLASSGINVENEKIEVTENDFYDELDIDAEDAAAFERFQNPTEGKRTVKLSELIMEKIAEKQADIHTQLTDDGSLKIEDLDPRVKEMYEGVRDVMKRYRSGKVPKAFKIIPKLRNWEQILFLTEPHNWSAAGLFQGTR